MRLMVTVMVMREVVAVVMREVVVVVMREVVVVVMREVVVAPMDSMAESQGDLVHHLQPLLSLPWVRHTLHTPTHHHSL